MHQSIETPVPRAPGHSEGLTRPKPGFNALLTARRPRGGGAFNKMSVNQQIANRCNNVTDMAKLEIYGIDLWL